MKGKYILVYLIISTIYHLALTPSAKQLADNCTAMYNTSSAGTNGKCQD
jgi:hypothetical protein